MNMLNASTPSMFGLSHILYAVITIIAMIVSLILIKKFCKSKRSQNIAIIITASLLLSFIIFNRISIATYSNDWLLLIPTSFCGMTSLLFSIATLIFLKNHNHSIFHFFAYIAFVGGILTTITPTFIGQASTIFHTRTISGLVHHSLAMYLAILILVLGRFKPSIKKIHCFWLGLTAYMTLGLFLIHAIGVDDAMYINNPAATGIYWYMVGAIVLGIHFIGLGVYELCKKKFANSKSI